MNEKTNREIAEAIRTQIPEGTRGVCYILNGEGYVQATIGKEILLQKHRYNPRETIKDLVARDDDRLLGFIPTTQKAYQMLISAGNFWPVLGASRILREAYVLYSQTR